MFCGNLLVFVALHLLMGSASAGLLTIDWNISTDRGTSHSERDYRYPMYQEVAPVPCDLTTACDAFCCRDPDCGGDEAPQCSRPRHTCSHFLSFFDCNCFDSDTPEWLFAFCYVHRNPIYLGKFYETLEKIDDLPTFNSAAHRKPSFRLRRNDGEPKAPPADRPRAAVMTFVPTSHAFPSLNALLRKTPLKDSAHACTFAPVNHRTNDTTLCLTKVTRNLCREGRTLGALPHLVQSSSRSDSGTAPLVLKDSHVLEALTTQVAIKCLESHSKTATLKRQPITVLHNHTTKTCPHSPNTYHTALLNSTCLNALAYVHYHFLLNGSAVVALKAEYGLTNIPLPHKYIYLKQQFTISFFDALHNSQGNHSQSADDEVFNRGYLIGEELNFGYKEIRNSSAEWVRGLLGVFGSGGSCESRSPVGFGHQVLSVCRLRGRFGSCSRLREAVEEKLDGLLRGDSLAAYANLRPPYSSSVPLLRGFGNSSGGGSEGGPGCEVAVVQEVVVQYRSLPAGRGRVVHRVIGVRVDRAVREVRIDADVLLTARALFVQVGPSKDKVLSRFWRKVLRRELSESAWVNILGGLEDADAAERGEAAVWCTALMLSAAVAIACGGADDSDYF